jgi:dihydroorotase (multifunctional complex type)
VSDLALKGGTVVTGEGRDRAHVYVKDGRIEHIGTEDRPAATVRDVTGLFVLPGLVDTHVHLMDPGSTDREDFPAGTRAAAARGVTTIIEHTHAHPVREVADLTDKVRYLEGRSNVDFGLAAHTWPDRLDELPALWEAGVAFFKMFTCTTHGVPGLDAAHLEAALEVVASFGGACLIHCEDESITARAEAVLREQGRTDHGVLIEWRSRSAEEVAVAVAGVLAARTGARATIAHVSSPAVAGIVQWARGLGADLGAEVCPQYLALYEDDVIREGPLRKFTPPARARTLEDLTAMWRLLRGGILTHVSTDHAPSTREQKSAGIWEAPFGLPGLDTTAPFLFDAVHRGVLEIEDVVRVYAEAPARRYGLHPRKGSLAPGADADLVVVDPGATWTVGAGDIVSKAGWSPFEGRTFIGKAVATYLQGNIVAEAGRAVDRREGRFFPGPGAGRG